MTPREMFEMLQHNSDLYKMGNIELINERRSQLCTQLKGLSEEKRPQKNSGLNRIRTHNLFDHDFCCLSCVHNCDSLLFIN